MKVTSLNIGLPQKETFYGKDIITGICKQPVDHAIMLTKTGFHGDGVGDRKHHGGEDKAVCAYSADHYAHWAQVLNISMPPSAFGENLTISGLTEEDACIGDVFRVGEVLVQVSQPRQPCSTLAARYGRKDFVKVVVDSGYTGWYFRVLQEGMVEPGAALSLQERDSQEVTIAFANQIYHHDRDNRQGIDRVLAIAALSDSWRKDFEKFRAACDE